MGRTPTELINENQLTIDLRARGPHFQAKRPLVLNIRLSAMGQGTGLSHRVFGRDVDAMCVVNDAIEDGIGETSATEVFVPVCDGQLRCHDEGAGAVALLDGLEEVLFLWLCETGDREVIDDKQVELGDALKQPVVGSLSASLHEEG